MLNKNKKIFDAIVIGGGFYGCEISIFLKKYFKNILIIEKEKNLLSRASYINQARVHNGYHYPRSFMTGLRSHLNFVKFIKDYKFSIFDSFDKVYAIAKNCSKISARQFEKFCKSIDSPIKPASKGIIKLFNKYLIEDVFQVKEVAFDAIKLKNYEKKKLSQEKIVVHCGREVARLEKVKGLIELTFTDGESILAKYVFNCTYSQINTFLKKSKLTLLPFKHEITELALIEVPDELKNMGITVMDGPFFSVMPFPAKKLHSLSHVRYTPHQSWQDVDKYQNAHDYLKRIKKNSNFPFMIKDAIRYIPILKNSTYNSSLFEVKTVLTSNEIDDGRPILFRRNYGGINNFYVIMGGKIDNIYDIKEILKNDFSQD